MQEKVANSLFDSANEILYQYNTQRAIQSKAGQSYKEAPAYVPDTGANAAKHARFPIVFEAESSLSKVLETQVKQATIMLYLTQLCTKKTSYFTLV